MYRIMIIEDDETIAAVMDKQLTSWGYKVALAEDFSKIMEKFKDFSPQLVLLDLSLPFYNGFHWCREIREISKVPIVFISSASDNMSLVTALHQGADDFIPKPFDLSVLVAKVQAILRRTYDFPVSMDIITHRGLVLNLADMSLHVNGHKADLTPNEFRILQLLLENKGRVVSREAIMRRLWEDESFIDDNTLTVNITRLRKTLTDAGVDDLIVTKKRLGYIVP